MSVLTERGIFVPETETLPTYIKRTENGLYVLNPVEGKEGPYDAVYDFGWSREGLREKVPVAKRIRENTNSLMFLGLENSDIEELLRQITEINHSANPENVGQRLLYQRQLYNVYKLMQPYFMNYLSKDKTVFFPPKNGGDLIRAFFQEMGIIKNQENVVDYELKRILLADGRLMVGVIEKYYPEGDYQTAVILDDCLASDVSVTTTMDIISKRYPLLEQTVVVVSAASQRGMQTLQRDGVTLIAGVPVFAMSHNYYLLRTKEEGYEEGTYFVGDMGQWAKPLAREYNSLAPWNNFR